MHFKSGLLLWGRAFDGKQEAAVVWWPRQAGREAPREATEPGKHFGRKISENWELIECESERQGGFKNNELPDLGPQNFIFTKYRRVQFHRN